MKSYPYPLNPRVSINGLKGHKHWFYQILLDGEETGKPIPGLPLRMTYFEEMLARPSVLQYLEREVSALHELFGLDRPS